MDLKRICIRPFLITLLVSFIFSSATYAQDAQWTKEKSSKQLEFDLFNMGINYHQQLGKTFSLRMHVSAGPRYYWAQENENPKNGAFFIPYLMAELRWYPGHKTNKGLKWNYTPLDGFYTHSVSAISFLAPDKIRDGVGISHGPTVNLGLGFTIPLKGKE